MRIVAAAVFAVTISAVGAEEPVAPGDVVEVYKKEKEKIAQVDIKSRDVMSALYAINERMKNMSRKRENIGTKVLGAEGDVKSLARSTAELEERIKAQRKQLAKRLKAIYMLGDEGVVRVIFSAASSQDLDQSLKYLRLVSDRDYRAIKSYENNLELLNKKKEKLKTQVRKLLTLRERLKSQEDLLSHEQKAKASLLSRLKAERKNTISKINKLRERAIEDGDDVYDISFYEQKRRLIPPVEVTPIQRFGLIENEEFQYRLHHKGHLYALKPGDEVRSVFSGRVAFLGDISGLGNTLILDHGDHYYSVYSGIGRAQVTEGDRVAARDVIARSLNRLYFELRHFSDAVDPLQWFAETP